MCFIGYNIKNIAKEDVKVEKFAYQRLTNNKIISPFFMTEWEIGETKTDRLDKTFFGYKIRINRGLHSCEKISVVNVRNKSDVYTCPKISPKVILILSFSKEDLLNFNVKPIICECVIPKGAIYYQNDYGEFVSNRLKIVSIKDI